MKKCLALFNTTYETLMAEDFFKKENIKFRPILKPRRMSSACRMALQFSRDDLKAAKKAVRRGNLELKGFYENTEQGWKKIE